MNELEEARLEIASVDREIAALFERRMQAVDRILDYKKVNGLPVIDDAQEERVIANGAAAIKDPARRDCYVRLQKEMISISRAYQQRNGGFPGNVRIGSGVLAEASGVFDLRRKVLVVTDEGVPEAYSRAVLDQCTDGALLVLPQGEAAKNPGNVELILAELLKRGFTRSDAVVAVGGGVVCDMAGFAAAVYLRGIDYYNVPTTLLSQVDSSVGGKTAVNFGGVKNSVGAFHQPRGVLVDTDVLSTLTPRLFSEGLAEVIKMAATSDAALFSTLETADDLRPLLPDIVSTALRIKLSVVASDPHDHDLRAVLNFGHTIGHAIEAASGEFYHGEAVGIGMLYMSEGEAKQRIEKLLIKFGLPTEDPFTVEELMKYVVSDKKRRGGVTRIVMVSEIGSYRFEEVDDAALRRIIEKRKI